MLHYKAYDEPEREIAIKFFIPLETDHANQRRAASFFIYSTFNNKAARYITMRCCKIEKKKQSKEKLMKK